MGRLPVCRASGQKGLRNRPLWGQDPGVPRDRRKPGGGAGLVDLGNGGLNPAAVGVEGERLAVGPGEPEHREPLLSGRRVAGPLDPGDVAVANEQQAGSLHAEGGEARGRESPTVVVPRPGDRAPGDGRKRSQESQRNQPHVERAPAVVPQLDPGRDAAADAGEQEQKPPRGGVAVVGQEATGVPQDRLELLPLVRFQPSPGDPLHGYFTARTASTTEPVSRAWTSLNPAPSRSARYSPAFRSLPSVQTSMLSDWRLPRSGPVLSAASSRSAIRR